MSDTPSRLWRGMPLEKRIRAADAFWRDTESPEIQAQHAEALLALARRLNFRVRTLAALPIERRARQLAQLTDLSDAIATRALIAYHFTDQRGLMAAFLDALGIAHEDGLITEEQVAAPDAARLAAAVEAVRASYAPEDVDLYLRTLTVLDGDTWVHLNGLLAGAA